MLKIVAALPERRFYQRIDNRGERWQWQDIHCDRLRILSPAHSNPWEMEHPILVRLENGKTGIGVSFPRRLNLVVIPENTTLLPKAEIIRERWFGGFAYSSEKTDLFFAFPSPGKGEFWLMLSIICSDT